MAHSIFVEGRELRDASGRMASIISSMTEIQRTISTIDNNAASRWQGRTATQNAENFRALNNLATSYLAEARESRNALDAAVNTYDRTESGQVSRVEQLSTQGIF